MADLERAGFRIISGGKGSHRKFRKCGLAGVTSGFENLKSGGAISACLSMPGWHSRAGR
jgi:hypothetical protein